MRIIELLNEMPIAKLASYGEVATDYIHNQFQKGDGELHKNTKAIKKIHNAFSRCQFEFNLYIFFDSIRKSLTNGSIIVGDVQPHLEKIQEYTGPIDTSGKITCCYFNNFAGANPKPMTAWTIAHRMGHAMQMSIKRHDANFGKPFLNIHQHFLNLVAEIDGSDIVVTLGGVFGVDVKYYPYPERKRSDYHQTRRETYQNGSFRNDSPERRSRELAMDLLTSKSGRDRKLNSNDGELFCELLAQYIIVGKVKLNRIEGFEKDCEKAEQKINADMHQLLSNYVGEIISF